MSVHGDPAARRAFILSDSFMRRIAPNLGIDVSDLPEVETLPVTKSPAEGMPVPASGVGSGVEGLTTDEEAGDREREMEVEGRGMVEEMEGAVARGEIDREWDGVGGGLRGFICCDGVSRFIWLGFGLWFRYTWACLRWWYTLIRLCI